MHASGEEVAGYLSLRVQQLDVRCDTKTKDNVFVTIVVSVQYQVCSVVNPSPARIIQLCSGLCKVHARRAPSCVTYVSPAGGSREPV